MASTHELRASRLFSVKDYVCLVTGGGSGIGLMATQTLAANGAKVYITGRNIDKLEAAAAAHNPKEGGEIIPLGPCDVTSKHDLDELYKVLENKEKRLDLLITNAGIAGPKASPKHIDASALKSELWNNESFTEWGNVLETNVSSVYFTSIAFLPLLQAAINYHNHTSSSSTSASNQKPSSASDSSDKRPREPSNQRPSSPSALSNKKSSSPGSLQRSPQLQSLPPSQSQPPSHSPEHPGHFSPSIIVISSMSGLIRHSQAHFSYNAAKGATVHLSKLMSAEFQKAGIRVNSIAPGYFPSELTTQKSDEGQKSQLPAEKVREKGYVPAGRAGEDTEMGMAVLFLARNRYVNGEVLAVDGGVGNVLGGR